MKQRSPILQRSIFALLSAEVISSLGAQMTFLALPWFVLTTTGSTTRMGIVLAAELLPIALFGIPSGAVVSRLGAVKAMLVCDLVRVPLMLSIPLLHAGRPALVPASARARLRARRASSRRTSPLSASCCRSSSGRTRRRSRRRTPSWRPARGSRSSSGPSSAGLLIAWIGAVNVLYVDAATYAVSFCLLLFFVPRRPPLPVTADGSGLLAGLRFVLRDQLLRPMLATAVFLHMFAQAIFVSLPVLAYDHYGASARTAGLMFGAFGARLGDRQPAAIPLSRRVPPMRLATAGILWVSAPLLLLGLELPAIGVMAVMFAAGLGAVATAPLMAILTTRAPAELRPKVMTAVITLITISGPVTVLALGLAARVLRRAHDPPRARHRTGRHGGRVRGRSCRGEQVRRRCRPRPVRR